MPRSGFQSFFKVLTQISPCGDTFGWNILVRKKPFGGILGNSLPRTSFTRKWPLAYGVPAYRNKTRTIRILLLGNKNCSLPGPSMIAWISEISSSFRITLIPSGGSLISCCNSLQIWRLTCGAKFSKEIWIERVVIVLQSANNVIKVMIITEAIAWKLREWTTKKTKGFENFFRPLEGREKWNIKWEALEIPRTAMPN